MSSFESGRGVSIAVDTTSGESVILKSFPITLMKHYDNAKEEAETLRNLG